MSITEGLKRGTIEIMLLTMLKDEDMYGYQICQEFESVAKGCLSSPKAPYIPFYTVCLTEAIFPTKKNWLEKEEQEFTITLKATGFPTLKR